MRNLPAILQIYMVKMFSERFSRFFEDVLKEERANRATAGGLAVGAEGSVPASSFKVLKVCRRRQKVIQFKKKVCWTGNDRNIKEMHRYHRH